MPLGRLSKVAAGTLPGEEAAAPLGPRTTALLEHREGGREAAPLAMQERTWRSYAGVWHYKERDD